jgi:hypothetical protein
MAHYAYLDENNIVVAVTVGKDETELIGGLDTETYYAQGTPYTVKRTSYNGNIRYNYAGIGYTYDPIDDAFISPMPYPSWVLNSKKQWEPPIAYPTDGKLYAWDEETGDWYETDPL